MKKSKILSGFLIICLILSTISIPAFGAEEDSKDLEQAITTAKSIITVPENYTEFTHNLSERETNDGKIRIWRLNWSEKEGKNGYISASVGEDGYLYEYNKYNDNENHNGFAKVTKDQAQNVAEEFCEKAVPSYSKEIKIVNSNSSEEEYNFTYKKFVNEVPVNFITLNINVNKYNGEVTSFYGGNPEAKGIEYPSLEGIIGQNEAEKAYIEKLGVNLKYYSNYDYKQKKMNIFAGYSIDENGNKAIDAKTGQAVSNYKENQFYDYKDTYGAGNGSEKSIVDASMELTKEETDEVKNVANLISKEKAEDILKGASDVVPADIKIKDAELNKNHMRNVYTWRISFENGYGEVNAESGEIISIHYYNKDNTVNKNISKAQAKNIAENFLRKMTPDKFAKTRYIDSENNILKNKIVEEGNNFSFNYIRQVNGIDFSSNSLRVTIDGASGRITGYNNNWYDDVSFPDISKVMTKEEAFNKIKELAGFSLQFIMLDKDKVGLVYNFKNEDNSYIIDPVSGTRLDFTGQVYKENKLQEYVDISGHWCEKTVKELLDNGYYIDGNKFNPDMNITQVNFLKYLYSPVKDNYNNDDEFYDMLIQNGIITKEEKDSSSLVSNQDAAKYIIRYLGYDKVAVHSEIFNNPFKDNIEEKYKGYASMCYGLNIIKGTNGNFNGTHNISNAEAAVIIYNSIKNNTK